MSEITLRSLRPDDWVGLAELVYTSLKHWYESHAMERGFTAGPESCSHFTRVYESLDPGCCVVAEHPETRRLMAACFYHVRETHVSVGIMSVHPAYAGRGVARQLLKFITDIADGLKLPTRLVSSAMNLDSFSLYNRAGFVPRCLYQDIVLDVPPGGVGDVPPALADAAVEVRDARPGDVDGMRDVELRVSGISRVKDYRYFIERAGEEWHVSVATRDGRVAGYLMSRRAGAAGTTGPGVAVDSKGAAALLARELNHLRGSSVLVLVPADYPELVAAVYGWGGRNVELHLAQVRGAGKAFDGVTLPTFMPETG
jgi:GNAT superfamily N-acetyltransferase